MRKSPNGKVRKYKLGDVFQSKGASSGDYEIIHIENSLEVTVRFIDTGSTVIARSGNIIRGQVEDPLAKTVAGVGYRGIGIHSTIGLDGKQHTKYHRWKSMIERCYNEDHEYYPYYGAKGGKLYKMTMTT